MARIRTIKPEFFKDEKIDDQLSDTLKLLWIGIWTLCDREGRLEDRPKFIKAEVFPYKSINIDAALTELHDKGFIHRYSTDGKRYIQSKNFLKYQRPYHKEPPSEIPFAVIAASSNGHDREENAGLWSMENGHMENGIDLATKKVARLKISLSEKGNLENINPEHFEKWQKAFPALNLKEQIAKAEAWLLANPKNKKSNYERFLVNWFNRNQDSARPEKTSTNAPESTIEAWQMEWGTILTSIKRSGSGQRIEGISQLGRIALSKIGGPMTIGQANDFALNNIKKDFKNEYLYAQKGEQK